MRYLIFLLIAVVISCGGGGSSKSSTTEKTWIDVGIDGYQLHDEPIYTGYNGDIDIINHNSWVFTSHTNPECIGKNNHQCKKSDLNFIDSYRDDIVKYSFQFELVEYNGDSVIIFQDWRPQNILESMGRHPITTIKIKNIYGRPYATLCENSWQNGYDFVSDPEDKNHSLHQKNDCHGVRFLELGVSVYIDIILSPKGSSLIVNDIVISDVEYIAKSKIVEHKIQVGPYWYTGFNNDTNDPLQRIVVRIDNFTRAVAIE